MNKFQEVILQKLEVPAYFWLYLINRVFGVSNDPIESVVKPSEEVPWMHIKYLALQNLVLAARDVVTQKSGDPEIAGLKTALEYYQNYWNDSH